MSNIISSKSRQERLLKHMSKIRRKKNKALRIYEGLDWKKKEAANILAKICFDRGYRINPLKLLEQVTKRNLTVYFTDEIIAEIQHKRLMNEVKNLNQ